MSTSSILYPSSSPFGCRLLTTHVLLEKKSRSPHPKLKSTFHLSHTFGEIPYGVRNLAEPSLPTSGYGGAPMLVKGCHARVALFNGGIFIRVSECSARRPVCSQKTFLISFRESMQNWIVESQQPSYCECASGADKRRTHTKGANRDATPFWNLRLP